jgi:hypothetical protein
VLLVLDANPRVEEAYRAGHPSLKGRVMFGLYAEAEAEAAVFNIQDPKRPRRPGSRRWSPRASWSARAATPTPRRRATTTSPSEVRRSSGAQIISTDYYPGAPDPLDLKFVVAPPGSRQVTARVRLGPSTRANQPGDRHISVASRWHSAPSCHCPFLTVARFASLETPWAASGSRR